MKKDAVQLKAEIDAYFQIRARYAEQLTSVERFIQEKANEAKPKLSVLRALNADISSRVQEFFSAKKRAEYEALLGTHQGIVVPEDVLIRKVVRGEKITNDEEFHRLSAYVDRCVQGDDIDVPTIERINVALAGYERR